MRTVATPILGANRGEGWSQFGLLRSFLLCIFLLADLGLWVLILVKDQGESSMYIFVLTSSPFLRMVIVNVCNMSINLAKFETDLCRVID